MKLFFRVGRVSPLYVSDSDCSFRSEKPKWVEPDNTVKARVGSIKSIKFIFNLKSQLPVSYLKMLLNKKPPLHLDGIQVATILFTGLRG